MNRAAIMIALAVPALLGQKIETREGDPQAILRIETARDHLSVIELSDPVTMVAVGNRNAFSVEWRDNKIFVTPTEDNAKTNLFIWTADRRYAYELAPAAAVEEMHFVIDQKPLSSTTKVKQMPAPNVEPESPVKRPLPPEMLTRANPILIYGDRQSAKRVEVSLREWYEKDNRVYLRYALLNRSEMPYHSQEPKAVQLTDVHSAQSLIPLGGRQLGEKCLRNLKAKQANPVAVLDAEPIPPLLSGAPSLGWLVLEKPQHVAGMPPILKIEFTPDSRGDVAAVLVLPRRNPEVAHGRPKLPAGNN